MAVELEQLELDPTERAFFIERTGVIMRWILITTCSIIQLFSPVIPELVFYIALPSSIVYNSLLNMAIHHQRRQIIAISRISTLLDIIVSIVLIYYAGQKDIYLWYFVLLVSHAARFGFYGSIISPLLFSLVYIAGLYLQGIQLPPDTLVIRCTFFIITGVVSGYLAREEHKRFDNLLRQEREYLIAQLKRKELRAILQRYVSYNIVDELICQPDAIKMGGCRRKVTVLFADIQGFTQLLTCQQPEAIVNQLNEYLTAMSGIIFEFSGMVDKFVGDAIIGIFGAICEKDDDASRAVCCALAMQEKLKQLQEKWLSESAAIFHSRIAVNSGEVIMGNIGSPQRMDFTAIGDPVNTAARLQAIAEIDTVVITVQTYQEVNLLFSFKRLGQVALKGKPEPVEVFEVQGVRHEV